MTKSQNLIFDLVPSSDIRASTIYIDLLLQRLGVFSTRSSQNNANILILTCIANKKRWHKLLTRENAINNSEPNNVWIIRNIECIEKSEMYIECYKFNIFLQLIISEIDAAQNDEIKCQNRIFPENLCFSCHASNVYACFLFLLSEMNRPENTYKWINVAQNSKCDESMLDFAADNWKFICIFRFRWKQYSRVWVRPGVCTP